MQRSWARQSWVLVAFFLVACGSEPLGESRGETLSARVGEELSITLQTIGPGEYQSPPAVSSSTVRFVDVAYVSPFVPAGPTQRFRFRAEARGRAIVTFRHSGSSPMVHDTIEVR